MHRMKKMLPLLFVLFLVLSTLVSPAAACSNAKTVGTSGAQIQTKVYLKGNTGLKQSSPTVYRIQVPVQKEGRKTFSRVTRVTFRKCYPVYPPAPEPPVQEPPVEEPPLEEPPIVEPPVEEPPLEEPPVEEPPIEEPPVEEPPVEEPPVQDPPVTPPPQDPPVNPPQDPPVNPPQDPSSPPAPALSADEMQMWQLVNEERQKAGLQPLQIHEGLVELARLKSEDMILLGYFSHQSPTYGSPFEMMSKAGISYRTAGENIAGAPTVSRAHQALMNSPGHRANILNASFTHVGIGIVDGGPYGKMYTQMFIGVR